MSGRIRDRREPLHRVELTADAEIAQLEGFPRRLHDNVNEERFSEQRRAKI